MQINVNGKGINIGESLAQFSEQAVANIIDKYLEKAIETSVTISKNNRLFEVEIFLFVSKGFIMKTNGSSDDPYKAVTLAIERLEHRIKKHKNRLMNKQRREHWTDNGYSAIDYVLERKEDQNNSQDEEHLIIAES